MLTKNVICNDNKKIKEELFNNPLFFMLSFFKNFKTS